MPPKKPITLKTLLTGYIFAIDFDKPNQLVVTDTDILLSGIGLIDNLNYKFLVRPAKNDEDWKIYYIKNKNVGYTTSPLNKNTHALKQIVKEVKKLIA
jgi:hypothetical protein